MILWSQKYSPVLENLSSQPSDTFNSTQLLNYANLIGCSHGLGRNTTASQTTDDCLLQDEDACLISRHIMEGTVWIPSGVVVLQRSWRRRCLRLVEEDLDWERDQRISFEKEGEIKMGFDLNCMLPR